MTPARPRRHGGDLACSSQPRAPQFLDLAPVVCQLGVHVRYLDWFRRPQLWKAIADHDVLTPTTLEAIGLVALEAQAC
ncbi:hypothetical protein ACWC98_01890 [Streptomyces goshikiensis]|uniref:hypothetical protein n=1 Tax=Streptomyces goshikiensis TaxID=1942 RepID=UPI00365D34D9